MKQIATLQKTRGNLGYQARDASAHDDDLIPSNVSLIGSDHESAELNIQLGDLRESLAKAERRIERLLGERTQLKTLLDRRDVQIQQLNRELGTHQVSRASVESDPRSSPSWRDLMASIIGWLGVAGEKAPTRVRSSMVSDSSNRESDDKQERQPSFDCPPLIANYKKGSPKAVLAVVAFGMDENELRNLLPVIERDSSKSGMMPLILTDNDAFEVLRERNMIFEYLPPAEDRNRFSRQLNWDLYLQRRLSIIRKKWQPTRVIALGQMAAETLRLWHESPFEAIPLPTVIKS